MIYGACKKKKKTSNYQTCLRVCGTRQWTQVNGLNNFLLKVIIQLIGVSISSRIGSIKAYKGLNLVGSFYLHGPVIGGSTEQTFYEHFAFSWFTKHPIQNDNSSCTFTLAAVLAGFFMWFKNIFGIFYKKFN
jgi:hypothetical protein